MQDAHPLDRTVSLGASWYPEMWPETDWPADLARMREVGFNTTRLFEFAWHRFEPREGEFDFDWARRVLDLCHAHGVRAMLGTPTAAPPAWLTRAFPDTLATDSAGRRDTHGRRRHYNHHSAAYRRLCARIVERMARELGRHPAVCAWQVDNEMSGFDYGPETRAAFHAWLRARFGAIEALNAAWGLEFWSQAYDAFETIPFCPADVGGVEIRERHHPSLIMAVARFQNEAWTRFIRDQVDLIRIHSPHPVTTNMVPGLAMDWARHNRLLDRVGFSMYRDVPHYHWNWPNFDRMRAAKPAPYWLLETAPNWSAGGRVWNIHEDAAGMRLMAWMSLLFGGAMVLYWQWREHWAGQEMLHGTLVTATGAWRPGARAAHARIAGEFAAHGEWLLSHPPAPAAIGIVLDSAAACALSIDPTDDEMVYERVWRDTFYLPLAEAHYWRDVIDPDADLDRYRLLVLPLMPIVSADLRARLRAWVERGGCLFIGPLTGHRTEDFTAWRDRALGGLEDLIGATAAGGFTVKGVESRVGVRFAEGGMPMRTRAWCEGFTPAADAAASSVQVLAHYAGGYGDGLAAVVEHRLGRGRVIACGCLPDRERYLALIARLAAAADIKPVAAGSPRVQVVPRLSPGGRPSFGLMNFAREPQTIRVPGARGSDRLTGQHVTDELTLDPLGIMLIEARG